MENKNIIFWFSGTGNSLYVAKFLAEELGGAKLVRITEEAFGEAVGGEGAKVGFAFPSYYCNLPRAMRAFAERLEIKSGSYVFAVVAMGAIGQGSVGGLKKLLSKKGTALDYGKGVLTPANYVMKYDPAESNKFTGMNPKIDSALSKIAEEIKTGKRSVKSIPFAASNLYKDVEALDARFVTNDGCDGCGVCEKVCPVNNIRIESGAPVWKRRCEHCAACISWCPKKAIDYGSLTQARRRYRNPKITLEEMTRE